jgi:serine/threonine protein kinase
MLSEGGEGRIFLTDDPALVCKIYRSEKLTDIKQDKIKLMLTRPLRLQGIAWPIDSVTNAAGQFCGYIMPKARGVPMQPTIFVKPHFEKTLPTWRRRDLARVCLRFLELVKTLHDANILVGDINPLNVLINPDSTDVWLVDTDSFQIENYPCPVGTVHFTAPEIQGQDYGRFLRTKDHELFAVATMLFAILLCGKYPYSQQGGGTPAENIRNKVFPYPFHSSTAEHRGLTVPPGTYRFMWSHLTHKLKEAFHDAFREGMRVPIDRWIELIDSYGYSIARGYVSDELFPKQEKITDGTETLCGFCGTSFTIQTHFLAKLEADGKSPSCPSCRRKFQLQGLAKKAETASNPNRSQRSSSSWHIKKTLSPRLPSKTRWTSSVPRQVPFLPSAGSTPTRKPQPPSQPPASTASPWWGIAILVGILGTGYAFGGVVGVVIVIFAMIWLVAKSLKT